MKRSVVESLLEDQLARTIISRRHTLIAITHTTPQCFLTQIHSQALNRSSSIGDLPRGPIRHSRHLGLTKRNYRAARCMSRDANGKPRSRLLTNTSFRVISSHRQSFSLASQSSWTAISDHPLLDPPPPISDRNLPPDLRLRICYPFPPAVSKLFPSEASMSHTT